MNETRKSDSPGQKFMFIIPWGLEHLGGVNQVVANLVKQLVVSDVHDAVVLNSEYGNRQCRSERHSGGFQMYFYTLLNPLTGSRRLRTLASFMMRIISVVIEIRKILVNEKITAVNIHYPSLAIIPVALATKLVRPRIPFILSFHGLDLVAAKKARHIWKAGWWIVVKLADNIVFCSQALADDWSKFKPASSPKVHVIHNGIDVENLTNLARVGSVPECLRDKRFILNVATLERKKGQDILIRAFARLSSEFTDVHLAIMGRKADAWDDLLKQVSELSLSERVHVLPDVPHKDVLATMKVADIFVLPSRSEPFGIVLLEAGLFMVPIVASRVGGIVEVINKDIFGVLTAPENASELAESIKSILNSENEASQRASEFHDRVVNTFTWKKSAAKYIQLVSK